MDNNQLRERRSALGLSQTQLAQRLGVSLRSYQEWESGKTAIRRLVDLAMEALETRAQKAEQ